MSAPNVSTFGELPPARRPLARAAALYLVALRKWNECQLERERSLAAAQALLLEVATLQEALAGWGEAVERCGKRYEREKIRDVRRELLREEWLTDAVERMAHGEPPPAVPAELLIGDRDLED